VEEVEVLEALEAVTAAVVQNYAAVYVEALMGK
jgi:hypothetical protein